jgi:uncharacterized membrane protein YeaQ/YmgE (transglycosylase-associated protein family)
MKDLLYAVVGLIAAGVAVWQIYDYLGQKAANVSHDHLIYAIIAAIVALACGGLFLSGRVNKSEEIHITE